MNFKWVIEHACFEENADKFNEFTDVIFVKYKPFDTVQPFESISAIPDKTDHSVIFYGSINLGRRLINLGYQWQIWLPDKVFDCNYWMSRYKEESYNERGVFVPFGYLYEYMTEECRGNHFIRPNSGYKLFGGHVIDASSPYLDKEILYLKNQYLIQPEDLIFISEKGQMEYEYRFVICKGLDEPFISSASQYKRWFELETSPNVPQEAYNYVDELLKNIEYDPAPAWTLDICYINKIYSVVETGSFSSAGLYNCNIGKIVKDVETIAKELINE